MKTKTGMIRRIDEIGRLVIPKEIRKQLMLKEGESISFVVEDDQIILTKFSVLNKMSPTIQALLDGLYQKYHNTFLLCDNERIFICSSYGYTLYQRKLLSEDLKLFLQQKQEKIEVEMEFINGVEKVTLLPLIVEQETQGAIIMLTKQSAYYTMDESLLHFVKDVIEQEMQSCV